MLHLSLFQLCAENNFSHILRWAHLVQLWAVEVCIQDKTFAAMYLLLFEFIIYVRIVNSNCKVWNLITAYEKWLILPSIYFFFSWSFSLLLSSFLALLTVWSQGCAPIVLLPSRNALATAPHWFLYYCSSHDDISHFVSSAVFPPLISIADYSASVSSDLMRELLLPSFTVIALCSPSAGRPGRSDSTERGAANIIWGGGGNQHSDISAGGCDWQRTIQAHMGQTTNTVFFWHELCKVPDFVALSWACTARF